MKPQLLLAFLAATGAASAEQPVTHRRSADTELVGYMFREGIKRVCVELVRDAEGVIDIRRSAGRDAVDRVAVMTASPGGSLHPLWETRATDVGDGRRALRVEMDISHQMRRGRTYCPAP